MSHGERRPRSVSESVVDAGSRRRITSHVVVLEATYNGEKRAVEVTEHFVACTDDVDDVSQKS